jgi:cation:H+ antiporter
LPILIAVSLLSIALVWDGSVVRWNGVLLLVVFALVMAYSIWRELKKARVEASNSVEEESAGKQTSLGKSIFWLVLGLALLVASSRALVWGAVEIARTLGVSDLLIGLTIVAVGTSLPELASSIAAARKGENDLALGNIIGSNLFNTLAVVGLAATISPMDEIEKAVTYRDMPLMTALTVALIVLGFRRKGEGRLNRIAGAILLAVYVGYLALLIAQAKG